MPRLRNRLTGAVVNVADVTATRLGSEWQPIADEAPDPAPEPKRAPRKRAAKKRQD